MTSSPEPHPGETTAGEAPPVDAPRAGATPEAALEALPPQRVLSADELFVGQKEVLIRNGAEIYRLRRTRNGKLILCK